MLCSPMMIPPHRSRRLDPLWANLDLVRIARNHVEKCWKIHVSQKRYAGIKISCKGGC